MKDNGGNVFQVFPVSQQTEEDTSPLDLFSTLKNITVGVDGGGGNGPENVPFKQVQYST